MKKLLCFLMILTVAACLMACRSSADTKPAATEPTVSPTTTAPVVTIPTTAPNDPIPQRPDTIYTQMETYSAKLYYFSSEELKYPILIYLYENQKYSIFGSPLSSNIYHGLWQINGDVLILGTPDSGYHFQITEAGLVFLAEPSIEPDNFIPMQDGNLFIPAQENESERTLYLCFPAMGGSAYNLYLYDDGHCEMAGPGFSFSGDWSREADQLTLHRVVNEVDLYYRFRITQTGMVYLKEASNELYELVDGDIFEEPLSSYGTSRGFLYTFSSDPQVEGYQLFISCTNTFNLMIPSANQVLSGKWTIEEDILTLTAWYYSADYQAQESVLCFRLSDDIVIFQSDLSDTLPEELALPADLIMQLTKAQLP